MTAAECQPSMPAYLLREIAAEQQERVRLAAMELAAQPDTEDDELRIDGIAW